MDVTKDEKIVLQGTRDVITGLWIVPIQNLDRPTHQRNNVHQVNGKDNSVKYLHAAAFTPVQDTWAKAVNWRYFDMWPVITTKDINKIPKAEVIIKGCFTQIRNNTRS